MDARGVAPSLNILVPQGSKKSPSPIRIRQRLLKGVPKVYSLLGGVANLKASSSTSALVPEEGKTSKVPEACPEGQSLGGKIHEEGQSPAPSIPEAQPSQVEV